MSSRRQCVRLFSALGAFGLLMLAGQAQADMVEVMPDVTLGGGIYHFNYHVTNNNTDPTATLALINIPFGPSNGDPMNLAAPAGFQAVYSSGILSFLEDDDPMTTGSFDPGTTISGFMIDSTLPPDPGLFDALDANGATYGGITRLPTNVPEPGSVALLGATLAGGAFLWRRRR